MRHLPIKRVLSLGAGILLGLWVLGVLIHMQGESQASLHSEARNRAQALVAYAARDMKRWIKEDKNSELERLAQDLAAEPEILDATLYDARGIPLAQSDAAVPLDSLLPTLPVQAQALAAWRLDSLWVSAVRLRNSAAHWLDLDPRALQGHFLTATFQHSTLGPSGTPEDTTVVYLITRGHGLPQALLPAIAPVDASINLPVPQAPGFDDGGRDAQ